MQFKLNSIALLALVCYLSIICESRVPLRYRIRPECREKAPRRAYELPDVVLTGLVEHVYPDNDGDDIYSGSVMVKRVMKGRKNLQGNRVTIEGFGDKNLCYSNVRRRDTWIFFLSEISDGFLKLNGSLHRMNIQNLDRMNALVKDEPFRKRPDIVELPCETQYCQNNGNCVEQKSVSGFLTTARCECLTSCDHSYSAVCGSNGETFVNECQLRLNSCKRNQNYFVRFPGNCDGGRRTRSVHIPSSVSI